MANFQTAPKLRIVNSPDQITLARLSEKANGAFEPITITGVAATDAAATDLLKIVGVADLFKSKVTYATKSLSVPSQLQKSTVTVTVPSPMAGKEFTVRIVIKTRNLEHEFVRFDGKNQKERFYPVVLKAGDTASTVAARIAEIMQYDEFVDAYKYVNVSVSAGVVTLEAVDPGWDFNVTFEGPAVDDNHVTLTHAITKKSFEGRNNYRQLNNYRLQTEARTRPYAVGAYGAGNDELPVKGATYTQLVIKWTVSRNDLSGASMQNEGPVTGEYGIELFLNDGTVGAQKTILIDWLKANAKKFEEYNATTADAAIVAETPAVTTN
jgi:hypothetical protein